MAFYRNHVVATEPYEDSQGPESPTENTPEELQAFYEDMERREILERKLSKRKSNSGTSMWSRKSLKRWTTSPPPVPVAQASLSRNPSNSNLHNSEEEYEAGYVSEPSERNDISRLVTSRSVIGETAGNSVATDPWASVPLPSFKVNYPLHNPFGPRRYRNHHLIPPSLKKPSMRPPTFFSPSFPPMHTSSTPEHLDDRPESTNTSHTPSDTPASSQTRVGDGGKPRSRKTSQTAPDNVDLLDVTDPWGTNWHHQSPYDIGQTTAATSDTYDIPNRARRASFTATHNRNKSITPSPLSQSTSAVHLHPGQPEIHIPRKLSKRRTPTAENVFAPLPTESDRKFTSAPTTPLESKYVATPLDSHHSDFTSLPKRMSVAPAPVHSPMYQTPKKEKRGSMLNRLAKKFSILKRSSDDHTPTSDWWHHIDSQDVKGYTNAFNSGTDKGRASPEKSGRESVKRVPPPSINHVPDPTPVPDEVEQKRLSLTSLDAPISMGRLTITNPDVIPDSAAGTPTPGSRPPLPPEKPGDIIRAERQSRLPDHHSPSSDPPPSDPPGAPTPVLLSSDIRSRLDKPLPPPQLETPDISQIRLSDVRAAQALEQLLPPPSRPISPIEERTVPGPVLNDVPQEETDQPASNIGVGIDKTGQNVQNVKDRLPTASPPPVPRQDETTPNKSSTRSKGKRSSKEDSPQPETPTADCVATQTHVVTESRKENQKNISPKSQASRNADADSGRLYASTSKNRDRSAEASTTTLQAPLKPYRSKSRSDALAAPAVEAVPFPSVHPSVPEYEGSPLSTSSMLANPPTPYDHRMSIAMSDQTPPTLPPKSIYEGESPKNSSPVNPSPSRQTETFKLVRSSSGNVYASNQTITAAGEQWEVVESIEAKKDKISSRPKDQDQRHHNRDYRNKEYDFRSRDHERGSRDYDYRVKDERKSREYDRYERHSRDDRVRDEYRAREEQMAREIREENSREEQRQREERRAKEERKAREEQKAREERRVREEQRERVGKESERADRRAREEQREREEKERERVERRAREDQWEREEKERERRAREEQKEREEKERERRAREEQREREEKERSRQERKAREEQREREREEKIRLKEEQKAREERRLREEQRVREERKAKEDERTLKEELRRREHERRSTDYEHKSRDDHKSRHHYTRTTDYNHRTMTYDHPTESEYKSRDFDSKKFRESKRESNSKPDVDNEDYYRSSRRSAKQPVHSSRDSSNFQTLANGASQHYDAQGRNDKSKNGRQRDDYSGRHTERNPIVVETSSSSSSSDMYVTAEKSEAAYGIVQSNVPHMRLERNTSLTARPTSELPSAAEMNAVRAKESWEMERLWKARSLYGLEPNSHTTNFIPGSSPRSSRSDDINTQSAIHGSSHTAYVVQTPFQGGLGSQIYHSMPTGPPPIIYSSPSSIPSIPDNLSSYEPYEQAYRSFATSTPSDYRSSITMPRPPLANPLPEPPRESPFEISGLKNAKPSINTHSQTNDYWTKYNGITTSH